MFTRFRALLLIVLLTVVLHPASATAQDITILPAEIERNCRGGRAALYDECGSQTKLFRRALSVANAEGKTLLVSYGAEWCIWCHVFDAYIAGNHTRMTYRFSDPGDAETEQVTLNERPREDPAPDAAALHQFVADHFVLVHIEDYHSADGYDVLLQSGADAAFVGGLPYIFTVAPDGQYAAKLKSSSVETRRDGWIDWYRGYDRAGLMAELARMDAAAQ